MKRYLIFAYEAYDRSGGIGDLYDQTDDLDRARFIADFALTKAGGTNDIANVFDTEDEFIIYNSGDYPCIIKEPLVMYGNVTPDGTRVYNKVEIVEAY
jgi:hypothetical protein